MTPSELKSKRHALGLSAEGFAHVVGVESGRTVRRWEAGDRAIPGSVEIILDLIETIPQVRRYLIPAENFSHPRKKPLD